MLRRKLKQKQMKDLAEMTDDDVIEYFEGKFDETQVEFFKMQMQNPIEEDKRTFSTAQKEFSLALFREDPENYSSMRRIFVLPDESTIKNYSKNKTDP